MRAHRVVLTCFGVPVTRAVQCFPYGSVTAVEVQHGGLACCSGVMIPGMGDAEDAMVVAVAAVTVGH